MFNETAVQKMCDKLDIDLISRAHQVVDDGYEFFTNRKLVTIFSEPNYCGRFDNDGAILMVDDELRCFFLKLCLEDKQKEIEKPWKNCTCFKTFVEAFASV